MTGEMYKPPNTEKGEDYWAGKSGTLGMGSAIGDDSYLIRPNYPTFFELADKLKAAGVDAEALPFDTYQGPYIRTPIGRLFHGESENGWVLLEGSAYQETNVEFRTEKAAYDYIVKKVKGSKGSKKSRKA
jgi:hypothetical protein